MYIFIFSDLSFYFFLLWLLAGITHHDMIPENGMLVYDGDECAVYTMWIALDRWAGVCNLLHT